MAEANLTPQRLRELLDYDPATGVFTWRMNSPRGGWMRAGKVAGTPHSQGYVFIRFDCQYYFAHRLAWFWLHGCWPEFHIDHVDGNRANNAAQNLRDVTQTVNMQNIKRAPRNSSNGILGASPHGKSGFCARIRIQGKTRYLGTFGSAEEAHQAYLRAKRELHAGCTL